MVAELARTPEIPERPPPRTPRAGPLTYTPEEAARRLEVARRTVEVHWQDLGGYRVGKTIRFPREAIDRLLGERPLSSAAEVEHREARDELVDALLVALAEATTALCLEADTTSTRRLRFAVEGLVARLRAAGEARP